MTHGNDKCTWFKKNQFVKLTIKLGKLEVGTQCIVVEAGRKSTYAYKVDPMIANEDTIIVRGSEIEPCNDHD